MHSEGIQRVIVAEVVLDLYSAVADRACQKANEECSVDIDVPTSGSARLVCYRNTYIEYVYLMNCVRICYICSYHEASDGSAYNSEQ